MQYHCKCILGHTEPQHWLNPGVGVGFIPFISCKSALLGQLLYIYVQTFEPFCLKMQNSQYKGKKQIAASCPYLKNKQKQKLGQLEKGKQAFV